MSGRPARIGTAPPAPRNPPNPNPRPRPKLAVISKTGTVADLASKLNVTLPIPAGPFSFNQNITVPTIPLSGAVGISLTANATHGSPIACFSLSANI